MEASRASIDARGSKATDLKERKAPKARRGRRIGAQIPPDDEMHAYDTKDLERLFGLPASAVRALARAGNIQPVRRSGRLHYSFHDLVVLRTASALRAAKISSQRINKTLQELRSALPEGSRAQ